MADLPIGQEIPVQTRKDLFFKVENTPFGNKSLAFSILVPKTWGIDSSLKVASAELSPASLKPLAILRGMAGDSAMAYLQIQAMKLTREITAADWLASHALSSQRSILKNQELSPLFADAQLEFVIEETPFTMRAVARVDGDRLFFVSAFCPSSVYASLEQTFGLMVASFDLTYPTTVTNIEPRLPLRVGGKIRLQHPSSWRPRMHENLPKGRYAVDLYQIDDADSLQGLIRIKLAEKGEISSIPLMLQRAKAELTEAGVELLGELHNAPVESPYELFKSGQLLIFEASIEGSPSPQEAWIYLFETVSHFTALSLLTPAREHDHYVWAINRRAFELILNSIKYVA